MTSKKTVLDPSRIPTAYQKSAPPYSTSTALGSWRCDLRGKAIHALRPDEYRALRRESNHTHEPSPFTCFCLRILPPSCSISDPKSRQNGGLKELRLPILINVGFWRIVFSKSSTHLGGEPVVPSTAHSSPTWTCLFPFSSTLFLLLFAFWLDVLSPFLVRASVSSTSVAFLVMLRRRLVVLLVLGCGVWLFVLLSSLGLVHAFSLDVSVDCAALVYPASVPFHDLSVVTIILVLPGSP